MVRVIGDQRADDHLADPAGEDRGVGFLVAILAQRTIGAVDDAVGQRNENRSNPRAVSRHLARCHADEGHKGMSAMPARNQSVAGLVLAAGFSRRFGSDKRRARLNDGQTLLAASLALPCSQLQDVWVVLRPEDEIEALGVPECVQIVHSASAVHGMGHSLASGMRAVGRTSADAVAIFLGDMPWIEADSLRSLLAVASPERILVPTYGGQPGHPVIFGREFWPALLQLTGDAGAKTVLQAHPQAVRRIELKDPGILRDIDIPQFMG